MEWLRGLRPPSSSPASPVLYITKPRPLSLSLSLSLPSLLSFPCAFRFALSINARFYHWCAYVSFPFHFSSFPYPFRLGPKVWKMNFVGNIAEIRQVPSIQPQEWCVCVCVCVCLSVCLGGGRERLMKAGGKGASSELEFRLRSFIMNIFFVLLEGATTKKCVWHRNGR